MTNRIIPATQAALAAHATQKRGSAPVTEFAVWLGRTRKSAYAVLAGKSKSDELLAKLGLRRLYAVVDDTPFEKEK